MSEKIIHLLDIRTATRAAARVPEQPIPATGRLLDTRDRAVRDLRISVTDRCNFRCIYCMPKSVFDKDYPYLARSELLSFEEIERIARLFVAHGVNKLRITGGEPLLRKDIEKLIERLARLPVELTLTTNGALLPQKSRALRDAGLSRVTVSLDAIDDATFRAMNDVDFPVARVLEGIDAAHAAGPQRGALVFMGATNYAAEDQHGRQARHQRSRHRADGAPLQGQRPHRALHRVHGRRLQQWLEDGRSAAQQRRHRAHPRRNAA